MKIFKIEIISNFFILNLIQLKFKIKL